MSAATTKKRSPTAPLIAGFSGGVVSTTLLFPLDVIKVRLQVHESSSSSSSNVTRKRPRTRLSSLRILGGIVKYEGIRGVYSGWTPAVVGSAISWGGYFFLYEGFKRRLVEHRVGAMSHAQTEGASSTASSSSSPKVVLSSLDNFTLACAAGGFMVLLTNPVWLIKTRMQLQMRKASEQYKDIKPYNGMVDAARTIVREEGFLALYRGSGPALLLTTHGGVQFVVYEFLRKHFHYNRAKRDDANSIWERLELSTGYLTIGAVAKIVASTTTYPLQVLKARMQQRSQSVELTAEGQVKAVQREYTGMMGTARRLLQKEGAAGFFKGILPNAIRVAPGAAITFVVYEAVMDYLE